MKECKRRRWICIINIYAPGYLYVSQVVKQKCEIGQALQKNKAAIYLPVAAWYVLEKSWIQFTISP